MLKEKTVNLTDNSLAENDQFQKNIITVYNVLMWEISWQLLQFNMQWLLQLWPKHCKSSVNLMILPPPPKKNNKKTYQPYQENMNSFVNYRVNYQNIW